MATKYIFVSGGVVSGLGKGITAASLGRLLKSRGLKVVIQKFDPYINVDPGIMSPYQHGEVFVTEDGAECDLDVGHYERFIDENLGQFSNLTAGKIYWSVISKERVGEYLGGTVQVIPHITNEIKENILRVSRKSNPDVVITEIGGTVGDIESLPFLEAIRQLKWELGSENCVHVHVTLVPYIRSSGEIKTKPTQHSVKELRSIGIQPDIIVCRSEHKLTDDVKAKIGLFCNVSKEDVIENSDAESLYEVPMLLKEEGLDKIVCKKLNLSTKEPDYSEWLATLNRIKNPKHEVTIALVGKYVELQDAYLSIAEAIKHAGVWNDTEVKLKWYAAGELADYANAVAELSTVDAVLVPGSYGDLGMEGKVNAIRYARENNVPFLGICTGMHFAAIEFAANVLKMENANTTEIMPDTLCPIVKEIPLEEPTPTALPKLPMRLGNASVQLTSGSIASRAYGKDIIEERHRHRHGINEEYAAAFAEKGFVITGMSDGIVEVMELKSHPWFVGVQYNPEFQSRPNRAHPLLASFVRAALEAQEATKQLRLDV